jgi:hypothetical protein
MAYHSSDFEVAIGAAAGADQALQAELKAAFAQSVARQADLLGRARCDGNWLVAAERLQGLAASFHAHELAALAREALEGAPGDPEIVVRIRNFSEELAFRD